MEAFLSIVASLASIAAAVWSVRGAIRARTAAEIAERVQKELVGRRRLVEVTHVQAEIKRVLALVARIGPTSTSQLVKGINCAEIAREVEALGALLIEQRSHFTDVFSDRATQLRNDLRPDIEALAEAKSFEEKKRCGKSIYYKIESFAPIVKALADERNEGVVTL